MAANPISKNSVEAISSITRNVAIDYSGGDQTLAVVSRSLSANVAGTVVLQMANDSSNVTRYMQAGIDYPWAVKIIRNSGTTAGMGLVAGY